ncbi:hypothetical protein [Pseudoroseicyclus tamaricis]|uniref:O-antigen ligase-like membrane protein n=1 Tax=Pseudoroseicyclus tamaricis TaxID=2705421 RepID=A0A6B2JNG7_9RHOB|nr:hypothetical protein [Pseudoroseicyclus tamaricis]NDU99464.1 hypothetical protein [Pseudoroseicyclus tamaricis]
MPNALAQLALLAWPVASFLLFRKLPAGRALIASLLIAYLLLPPQPAGVDLPLLPPLTKNTIPSLVAFLLVLSMHRVGLQILPSSLAGRVLVGAFVFSPLATTVTNLEWVIWGPVVLPGLGLRDALASTVQQLLILLPFLLARALLSQPEDQRDLLKALVIAGLAYSLPMLLEVRLSPQLNIWVYGFFQHSFEQMMRGEGFRPIVFLYHGLWAAFFCMTCVVAALTLAKEAEGQGRAVYLGAALYLFAVLVACKSLASLVYGVLAAPLILLLRPLWQINIAALLACLALLYPVAKGLDLVPQEEILAAASSASHDRAASLNYRFVNEDMILQRAEQKPLFGWGGWGRNLVRDPDTGVQLSVPDGQWIVTLSTFGWVGFLAEFGLLVLPVFMLWRKRMASGPGAVATIVGPILLLHGINLADLIPNATLTPVTWLVAGGMLGYAEGFVPQHRPAPAPLKTVL